MNWVAWKMLIGDRAKFLGIVFGLAFGALLITQQSSMFVGVLRRTSSRIIDVVEPDIWVMDSQAENIEDIRPMPEQRLYQIRGIAGVEWAVRFFKGRVRVKTGTGRFRQGILLGLDDDTLVGAPARLNMGSLEDLRRPDAVIVDDAGFRLLFPGEPLQIGRTLEMNDHHAVIVGICQVTPPFETSPVIYTRYSQAARFASQDRNTLAFILAKAAPGLSVYDVCKSIERHTDAKAWTANEFLWKNIDYFMKHTGIPINFGITILLGFFVGAAIAGQTFYLFTLGNLKQFGCLKAMGVTNFRLVGLILLQATVVGVIGLGLGLGMAAGFFEAMELSGNDTLRGIFIPWQILAITSCSISAIVFASSMLSIRKVLVLEPAAVFK